MVPEVTNGEGLLHLAVAVEQMAAQVAQIGVLSASADVEERMRRSPRHDDHATWTVVAEEVDLAGDAVEANRVVSVLKEVFSEVDMPEVERKAKRRHG